MFLYAQINNTNEVVAVSQLANEVVNPSMIPIQVYDEALLGKIWNGTTFDNPPPPISQPSSTTCMTKLTFLQLFTDAELVGILSAAKSNPVIELFMMKVDYAQDICLTDPQTITAVNFLEANNLIGVGRAAQILSNTPHA